MLIPLVPLALSVIAGITVGKLFLYFPWSVATVVSVLISAALLRDRSAPSAKRVATFALAAAVSAVLLIRAELVLPPDHYLHQIVPDGSVHTLSGTVASPLDREADRTAFVLRADAIDGKRASGLCRVSLRVDKQFLGYGDRVTLEGRLHAPRGYRNPGGFDYPAHLSRQGIHAVLSVRRTAPVLTVSRGSGVRRSILDARERIREAFLQSTNGDGSAVLRAMVLGDTGGLSDDLRRRFMAAGVTHILSISGSHLGLVAVLCFWAVRNGLFLLPERTYHRITLSIDPRKIAAVASIPPVLFYALLAGGQMATVRSLIMILAGLASLLLDRDRDLFAALALAALIILIPDPRAAFDISFQLSCLSVVAIILIVNLSRVVEPNGSDRLRRMARQIVLLLAISLSTAAATGPLAVLYFRQVSLIGPLANMVVVPFAGAVVVPLGLVTGLLSLPLGSLPLAGLDQWAADLFVQMVSLFSSAPGASLRPPAPGVLAFIGCMGIVISTALIGRALLLRKYRPLDMPGRMHRGMIAAAVLSCLLLAVLAATKALGPSPLRLTFLDVGQGDCALLETREGSTILIDGGGAREDRFDIGGRVVEPFLADRGIRTIDLAVLSHPHPDHMNGLTSLFRRFPATQIWSSGLDKDLEGYDRFAAVLQGQQIPLREVSAGTIASFKDTVIQVLHPEKAGKDKRRASYAGENDRSLVIRISTGSHSFLFPGDIHAGGERSLLSGPEPTSDIVKVPHHGSRTSSSATFIDAVRPSAAVISVGAGNPYRHPHPDVVARYLAAGAHVYRTDRDGAVIVTDQNGTLTFRTGAELELCQISLQEVRAWAATERDNWGRLRFREWGI